MNGHIKKNMTRLGITPFSDGNSIDKIDDSVVPNSSRQHILFAMSSVYGVRLYVSSSDVVRGLPVNATCCRF